MQNSRLSRLCVDLTFGKKFQLISPLSNTSKDSATFPYHVVSVLLGEFLFQTPAV